MSIVGGAFLEVQPEVDPASFESNLQSALGGLDAVEIPIEASGVEDIEGELAAIEAEEIDVPFAGLGIAELEEELQSIEAEPIDVAVVSDGGADAIQEEIDSITPEPIEVPVEAPQIPEPEGSEDAGSSWMAGFGAGALGEAEGLGGQIAVALGAAVGIGELVAQENVKVQTVALLQATGNEAGVTAEHVANLAEEMQALTAVDAEVVQESENVLLRFSEIQNKVGEGNNIFDRATAITLDFARATGRDAVGAATGLGRALADPANGMTLLRRAGVILTDAQKESITTMQEQGNLLGAQRGLLDALEQRVGGVAAAYGDSLGASLDRAKIAGEDLAALFLKPAVPLLEGAGKAASFLAEGYANLTPEVQTFISIGGAALLVLNRMDKLSKGGAFKFGIVLAGAAAAMQAAEALDDQIQETFFGGTGEQQLTEDIEAGIDNLVESFQTGEISAEELRAGLARIKEVAGEVAPEFQLDEAAILEMAGAADVGTASLEDLQDAHILAARAARQQWLEEAQLAGGFVGLQAAQIDAKESTTALGEARAEVTKLEERGKRGTDEYREAVRNLKTAQVDAIDSTIGLRSQVVEYVERMSGDAAPSQKEVNALVRQFGREAGLTKGETEALISSVGNLSEKYGRVPKRVDTRVVADGIGAVINDINLLDGKLDEQDGRVITTKVRIIQEGQIGGGNLQDAPDPNVRPRPQSLGGSDDVTVDPGALLSQLVALVRVLQRATNGSNPLPVLVTNPTDVDRSLYRDRIGG